MGTIQLVGELNFSLLPFPPTTCVRRWTVRKHWLVSLELNIKHNPRKEGVVLWMMGGEGVRNFSGTLGQISMMQWGKFTNKWLVERKTQNEEWYRICWCLSGQGNGGRKIAHVWSLCLRTGVPGEGGWESLVGKSLLPSLPAAPPATFEICS